MAPRTAAVSMPAPEPTPPTPAGVTEADVLAGGPPHGAPAPIEPAAPPADRAPAAPSAAPAGDREDLEQRIATAVAAAVAPFAEILRSRVAPQPAAPDAPALPPKPDPSLSLTNPQQYQVEYDAYRDAVETQRFDARERKLREDFETRQREQDRQAAWRVEVDGFFTRHPDLDTPEKRPYTNAVYKELYQTDPAFRALPVDQALDRAGRVAREGLLKLTQGAKADSARPAPRFESSGPKAPAAPAAPEKPHSMADAIVEHRRRLREARLHPVRSGPPGARA